MAKRQNAGLVDSIGLHAYATQISGFFCSSIVGGETVMHRCTQLQWNA